MENSDRSLCDFHAIIDVNYLRPYRRAVTAALRDLGALTPSGHPPIGPARWLAVTTDGQRDNVPPATLARIIIDL